MSDPPRITLDDIVRSKREEVAARKQRFTIEALQEQISELGRPRNFFGALVRHPSGSPVNVIAEIKRKSPSAGWIRPEYQRDDFDPVAVARQYAAAGASAISCLTDGPYFAGDIGYIHRIRDAVPLPVLRKDFIIDPWQVYESRAAGADAVLLIAECLNDAEIIDLMILSHELGLTCLLEVHTIENLLRVRPHIGFPARSYCLLGINNRDLDTMRVDINHTLRLVDLVDDRSVLVSESGIRTYADLMRLAQQEVRIVLVGESLMREEKPGEALRSLLAPRAI